MGGSVSHPGHPGLDLCPARDGLHDVLSPDPAPGALGLARAPPGDGSSAGFHRLFRRLSRAAHAGGRGPAHGIRPPEDPALAGARPLRSRDVPERVVLLTSKWLRRDFDTMLFDLDFFVDRLWVIYYPALAVTRVPAVVPHEHGAILGRALLHVVTPRVLFPDKAVLESDSEMVMRYSGVWAAGAEKDTSIAFGYAAESYVDFGVPLMFLPVLAWGFLMGMAYHWWLRVIRHREIAIGLVTVMFWLALYLFERSWIKTLGLTVTMMVYLGGAAFVLDRYLLSRRGPETIRPEPAPRRARG